MVWLLCQVRRVHNLHISTRTITGRIRHSAALWREDDKVNISHRLKRSVTNIYNKQTVTWEPLQEQEEDMSLVKAMKQ